MRLAFISIMDSSPWGGSEELWHAAALEARRQGHEVRAWMHRLPQERPKLRELVAAGARVIEGADFHDGRWQCRLERFAVRHPNFCRRWAHRLSVFGVLLAARPDVVCLSQGDTYGLITYWEVRFLLDVLRARGIPYVPLCHSNPELWNPGAAEWEQARVAFGDAARIGIVYARQGQVLERQLARKLPQLTLVRNPVNLTDTSAMPWPAAGPARLAMVGRLSGEKGHDLLLEVLSQGPWPQRDWKLTIAGEGPNRGYLEALVGHLGLAARVRFAGQVTDLRAFWAEHHLHVLPSRTEAAPLVLVEAMLCGRPSVATGVGGIPEWVAEGATGFLAAAAQPAALAAALEAAWAARERWPELGRCAHERARGLADPQPGRTLLDLLIGCAAARRPAS